MEKWYTHEKKSVAILTSDKYRKYFRAKSIGSDMFISPRKRGQFIKKTTKLWIGMHLKTELENTWSKNWYNCKEKLSNAQVGDLQTHLLLIDKTKQAAELEGDKRPIPLTKLFWLT